MKSKPKLLIIDDNPEALSFLEDFGYDVNFLLNSKESLESLMDTSEEYNLIIINVIISLTSVWETLKFLRNNEIFEYVPIIVVTDLNDKTDELLALRSGADDFIRKPFDVDVFLARIDVALRRSMWNKLSFVNLKELPFVDLSKDFQSLTFREETILELVSKGFSNDDIAKTLCLSKLTVKTHIKNLFKKLNVNNRTEAIIVGLNLGLIKS